MITIETPQGPAHFKKAVFVWTGHFTSGWPTSFHSYIYNDQLNGLITFGHDDYEPEELTWFIPNGAVPIDAATELSSEQALAQFKALYGNRLIVWMNHKEGIPMLAQWAQSEFVVTCPDLGFDAFDGATKTEFKQWAIPLLDQIASDVPKVLPRLV